MESFSQESKSKAIKLTGVFKDALKIIMNRLFIIVMISILTMGFSKKDGSRGHRRNSNYDSHYHKPQDPKFIFNVIPLNSPVKDETARFLVKTPDDYQILDLSYLLINAFKLVEKEKHYSPAKLISGRQGKEFHLPVSSLPNGFYRLYVKITVKDKKGTHHGYLYRSRFHDFVKFTINRPKTVPMPDPVKNDATVAGIDSDNDGIRDDVQIWINQEFSANEILKKSVEGVARGYQYNLITADNKEASITSSFLFLDSLTCMSGHFGIDNESKYSSLIKSKTINTRERAIAILKSDGHFDDQSYVMAITPEMEKTRCSF